MDNIVKLLFKHYIENPEDMKGEFEYLIKKGEPVERVACDYIAGMTDRFAIKKYCDQFIPTPWNIY